MKYVLLAGMWTVWCFIHSALISKSFTKYLIQFFPTGLTYFRVIYNMIAVATIIPVLIYTYRISPSTRFFWPSFYIIFQILILMLSVFLFLSGARHYDTLQFLGLRRIKQNHTCQVITQDCQLDTSGILAIIRHPWYTAAMLLIWARYINATALVTNMVLTSYLIVGTILEEKKLRDMFKDDYISYQKQVSMFFPIKWLQHKWFSNS